MFDIINEKCTKLCAGDIIVWHKEHCTIIFGRPFEYERDSYTFLKFSKDDYDNEYFFECIKSDDNFQSLASVLAASHDLSVEKVETKINPTYRFIAAP